MAYTNEMRQAVRALENPTSLPIDVSVRDEQIALVFSSRGMARLNKEQKQDFNAYLEDVKDIIRTGGGGEPQVVVQQ